MISGPEQEKVEVSLIADNCEDDEDKDQLSTSSPNFSQISTRYFRVTDTASSFAELNSKCTFLQTKSFQRPHDCQKVQCQD